MGWWLCVREHGADCRDHEPKTLWFVDDVDVSRESRIFISLGFFVIIFLVVFYGLLEFSASNMLADEVLFAVPNGQGRNDVPGFFSEIQRTPFDPQEEKGSRKTQVQFCLT